jgi:transcriptional regulator with XRE-family HTH domain
MTIGNQIKIYRNKLKLTQEELATKSGLSRNAIYNYENEKRSPDLKVLTNIAEALNITINDLIENDKIELKINSTFEDAFKQFISDKRYLLDVKKYDSAEEYNKDLKILYENTIKSIEFYSFKLKDN